MTRIYRSQEIFIFFLTIHMAAWLALAATGLKHGNFPVAASINRATLLSDFSDKNIQSILDAHQDVFQRIREALPEYTAQMNFNPETASAVTIIWS